MSATLDSSDPSGPFDKHPDRVLEARHVVNEDQRSPEEVVEADRPDYEKLYFELLFAVGYAWPGETRHQTALRYILQAEHSSDVPQCEGGSQP